MIEVTNYFTGHKILIPIYSICYVYEDNGSAFIGCYGNETIQTVETFEEVVSKIKKAECEMPFDYLKIRGKNNE